MCTGPLIASYQCIKVKGTAEMFVYTFKYTNIYYIIVQGLNNNDQTVYRDMFSKDENFPRLMR